jgi:hypothetical protein
VLDQDGRRGPCRGSREQLVVHHRRAGEHSDADLVTLCAASHARVHRALALRFWLPAPLVELCSEWHPGRPRQEQFELALEPERE